MKIKRSSWHYKISNWGRRHYEISTGSDNLCWYFWRMIFKCLAVFAVTAYVGTILYFYFTSHFFGSITTLLLFAVASVAFSVVGIKFTRKKLGKSPEMPGGNIVAEYVRAKKAKICPLIEYVD